MNLKKKILDWEKKYSWKLNLKRDYSKEVPKSLQNLRKDVADEIINRLKALGYMN